MKEVIKIVPYSAEWAAIFEMEAAHIKKALTDNYVALHHVGSTAVPGLDAKPKIDIIAVVHDLCVEVSQLEALGYTFRGGFNIPLRKSFTKRSIDKSINLHIFEENDPEIELNILFRDYLRTHPNARNQYAALKYKLIEEESAHIKNASIYRGYTLGKNAFIQNIIKNTGFNKHRLMFSTHNEEWDMVKYLRRKYFFESQHTEDPYTEVFNHPGHKHLILYKGVEIVGYAHIQLFLDTAAIRIIVVDESKRNQSHGSKFLLLTEKWLTSLGVKSIYAKFSASCLKFFLKNGYSKMPFDDPECSYAQPENTDIAVGKALLDNGKCE